MEFQGQSLMQVHATAMVMEMVMETTGLNSSVETPETALAFTWPPVRAAWRSSQSHNTSLDPPATSSAAWSFRVVSSLQDAHIRFTTSRIGTSTTFRCPTDHPLPQHSLDDSTYNSRRRRQQQQHCYLIGFAAITMTPKKTATAADPTSEGWVAASKVEITKVWDGYWATTNHQTKVIDVFLAFLVAVGGIQFLYFVAGGMNASRFPVTPPPPPFGAINIARVDRDD